MERYDVAIVGAGVVGAALARTLSRYKLRVILFEREVDVGFGTSKANSGIIHSGIHDKTGSLKATLCVKGNRLYPEMAEQLGFLYRQNGSLVVAKKQEEWGKLKDLQENAKANGVMDTVLVNAEELHRLEPNLSPHLIGGLSAPSSGIVVPFDLVYALTENAVANGVRLALGTEVLALNTGERNVLIQTTQGFYEAEYLVNAAGVYSEHVARMASDSFFTIRLRKGEEYLLDRRLDGLVQRTIFPLPTPISKGILVIPTVDGNIMLGPTAKEMDEIAVATSAEGWNEVFRNVIPLLPSVKPSDLITAFAGLRASSDRGEFIIETSPRTPRIHHAAGIASPGLTAAPAIAELLVEHLREAGLRLQERADFNPIRRNLRFRDLSPNDQEELIAEEPSYARIICRCETISEAEIRSAIRRGATTVDGVKLRTRSGMGRCQGGFCTPKIIKLLSEELGIEPENITKRGPESPLLSGRLR